VRRGEIWTAASRNGYSGKPRPVLIVQDDRFSDTNSITVCPFTTKSVSTPLFRVSVDPASANGLTTLSWLMADKVATMPRTRLGRRIGRLDDETMLRLNRAMLVFLGLAG
jgi:mRNA interferase MazF